MSNESQQNIDKCSTLVDCREPVLAGNFELTDAPATSALDEAGR
jgi:hypothetical protein